MKTNKIISIGVIVIVAMLLFIGANYMLKNSPPNLQLTTPSTTNNPNTAKADKDLAKDFTLNDLNGVPVSLSNFRGKLVLLNFFATWCGPCTDEMPYIQTISEEYKDSLVVVAVNLNEDATKVKQFMQDQNFTFPVLLDSNGSIGNLYRVTNIPASYFINENGKIIYKHIGGMDYEDIQGYLQNMAKK